MEATVEPGFLRLFYRKNGDNREIFSLPNFYMEERVRHLTLEKSVFLTLFLGTHKICLFTAVSFGYSFFNFRPNLGNLKLI